MGRRRECWGGRYQMLYTMHIPTMTLAEHKEIRIEDEVK